MHVFSCTLNLQPNPVNFYFFLMQNPRSHGLEIQLLARALTLGYCSCWEPAVGYSPCFSLSCLWWCSWGQFSRWAFRQEATDLSQPNLPLCFLRRRSYAKAGSTKFSNHFITNLSVGSFLLKLVALVAVVYLAYLAALHNQPHGLLLSGANFKKITDRNLIFISGEEAACREL